MGSKIKEIQEQPPAEVEFDEDEYEDEDEDEYEDEDGYEYVDDVVDDYVSGDDNNRQFQAVERIEQANLYLTLLNHQLFSPGSARPEIISAVENEIKNFILERLEVLLGMAQPKQEAAPSSIIDLFTDEQLEALKAIADRLISKKPTVTPAAPQIMPVQAARQDERTVRQLQATPAVVKTDPPITPTKRRTSSTKTRKKAKKKKKPKTIVIRPPTEEEGNRGSDGTNYSQAIGTALQPQQMPSQQQQNVLNQNSVDLAQGARSSGQAGEIGTLLNAAIMLAQKQNQNIKEDE